MRTKTLRRLLLIWTLFIGAGALWGVLMMFIDPSGTRWGMDPLLEGMQALPWSHIFFQSFIFPGIALLLLIGIPQLLAAFQLIRKNPYASLSGIVCGLILMLWICIQFIIWDSNPLSTIYFIFGALESITAFFLRKREMS